MFEPSRHRFQLGALVVGIGCWVVQVPGAFAASPMQDCKQLASIKIPATTIVSAEAVEAGAFKPPEGTAFPALQPFCRVVAVGKPSKDSEIRFEVWLPASGWNGRFWASGNGGFAGAIPYDGLAQRVAEGYATAGTDTGHQGRNGVDAAWASGHPEKVIDFGYRAIHEVTASAKRIVAAFYGQSPTHSYFSWCSNGGRQALMEAQRYPDDYDGIIAGAPAYDWTHLFTGVAWMQFIWLEEKSGYFSASKLPAIQSAALAACDGVDGVKDLVIDDPQRCTFDPSGLRCQGAETDACLTQPQLTALRKIYADAVLAGGTRLIRGLSPGAEAEPGSWQAWVTGAPGKKGLDFLFAVGFFRDFVFGKPDWNFHSFNPDRDGRLADQELASILNATDPDLGKFARRGGKLILYHGWNDPVIPALSTVDYYEQVMNKLGPKTTDASVRLFMVPGMLHCDGGPGPNDFGQDAGGTGDPAHMVGAALQRWVEQGIAPEQIIASKHKNDDDPTSQVVRTRPLCAYPRGAHYRGTGNTDNASSFECVVAP